MNERHAVERLRDRIAPEYRQILVHQNLANRPSFKREIESRLGFIPVLNEIDMVLIGQNGEFYAIEVKCFSVSRSRLSRPFYDGIGQSLSLMRYGFDHVALWHLFDGDIDDARLNRYGAATWFFIRNQLGLPLEFSYFRVGGKDDLSQFIVRQYDGPASGYDLLPIDDPRFATTWKYKNPFVGTEEAQRLRAILVQTMGLEGLVAEA